MRKWHRLIIASALVVAAAPLLYYTPHWYRQWRYSAYFKSQDIGFYKGSYGEHDAYYYYDYYQLSKGLEPESNRIPLTWGKKDSSLSFIDLDGDGIPEVHLSGYDPKEPGVNYFRFNPVVKNFKLIPFDEVPLKWQKRFSEDKPD